MEGKSFVILLTKDLGTVDWVKGPDERIGGILTVIAETQQARQFTLDELDHATKRFNPSNKIGEGGFGPVYKGLLNDGTIVAIKRRTGGPRIEFAEEVCESLFLQGPISPALVLNFLKKYMLQSYISPWLGLRKKRQ